MSNQYDLTFFYRQNLKILYLYIFQVVPWKSVKIAAAFKKLREGKKNFLLLLIKIPFTAYLSQKIHFQYTLKMSFKYSQQI